jgi:hypothetical protein
MPIGQQHMSRITTFETLEQQINETPGTPTVLEAMWDGDSDGWYLLLFLYTVAASSSEQALEREFLEEVVLPEGSASFTGERWNVCLLAEELGNKAAEKYNLTFYFPANMHPDTDCPTWPDRHLGIPCKECGKLLLPRNSAYIPDDICHHCHTEQEDNKAIKEQHPIQSWAKVYLLKGDISLTGSFWSENETSHMAQATHEKIKNLPSGNVVNILHLTREEVIELKNNMEKTLDRLLDAYEMPVIEEQRKRFVQLYDIKYKDKTYELMGMFNHKHDRIGDLIRRVAVAEQALAGDYDYVVYFREHFTHRDDSFLHLLRFSEKATKSLTAISKEYAYLLTKAEISETLKRLEAIGCIAINGDQVSITQVGERIL